MLSAIACPADLRVRHKVPKLPGSPLISGSANPDLSSSILLQRMINRYTNLRSLFRTRDIPQVRYALAPSADQMVKTLFASSKRCLLDTIAM